MTKVENNQDDTMTCLFCILWKRDKYKLPEDFGVCTSLQSDHFGHILIYEHPGCSVMCTRGSKEV